MDDAEAIHPYREDKVAQNEHHKLAIKLVVAVPLIQDHLAHHVQLG